MTKQEFNKILTELKSTNEVANAIDDALRKLSPDFGGISFGRYENLLIKTLELCFKDESEWISYFIYELDWGRKYKNGCITSRGRNVLLKTIDDLYDLLNKNLKKRKAK